MPNLGLGRRPQQSSNFLHLAAVHREGSLAEVATLAGHHIWPKRPGILNQGDTGTCVGHGTWYRLAGAPFSHAASRIPGPLAIYDLATTLDGWPENDHDVQAGTSVLAGVKALVKLGYATGHYDWIYDAQTALRWLAGRRADGSYVGGPLIIGVSWYDSMFTPDRRGFVSIAPGSPVAGGHCLEVDEGDAEHGYVGGPNSWGFEWGENGRWKMSLETFDRLLKEDGEAVVLTEQRLP